MKIISTERCRDWSLLAAMRGMMTGNLKNESLEKEKKGRNSVVKRGLLSEPHARLNTIEYEIRSNIEKTNKELEERNRIRKSKEEKKMEHDHIGKIIETYQKLLKTTSNKNKPNKEILEIVLDMYSFAYGAGEEEQSTRVHFFHKELINKDKLLRQCHGNK
jgi:hypothetical protein